MIKQLTNQETKSDNNNLVAKSTLYSKIKQKKINNKKVIVKSYIPV